jgi:hypothetical protein
VRLLAWLTVVIFSAFSLWLLHLLYFDKSWEQEMLTRYRRREVQAVSDVARAEAMRRRFHIKIPFSLDALTDPPVCFTCHTPYPHREDERARTYLNMHGTFLSCEVCHHRPEESEEIEYVWISDQTDQVVGDVEGDRGVYGAHVFPARRGVLGRVERLGKRVSEPRWAEFAERAAAADQEGREAMRDPVHDEVLEDPLECRDCHEPGGVMDFQALGYSPLRSGRLERLEVVAMLEETVEFHFPDLRGILTPALASPPTD